MWLLGHISLGYFFGSLVARFTGEKINIPLIWFCSLLPDVDEFFQGLIVHRGPTHSILVAIAIFVPIYLYYRRGLPYFAALASHSLVGDFLVPPLQFFWPISSGWFGAPSSLQLHGTTETLVEISLFVLMMALIIWRAYSDSKSVKREHLASIPSTPAAPVDLV
jgi:membrane-bound metal-dependent hydrolase YbcI (DUF457 family)